MGYDKIASTGRGMLLNIFNKMPVFGTSTATNPATPMTLNSNCSNGL